MQYCLLPQIPVSTSQGLFYWRCKYIHVDEFESVIVFVDLGPCWGKRCGWILIFCNTVFVDLGTLVQKCGLFSFLLTCFTQRSIRMIVFKLWVVILVCGVSDVSHCCFDCDRKCVFSLQAVQLKCIQVVLYQIKNKVLSSACINMICFH